MISFKPFLLRFTVWSHVRDFQWYYVARLGLGTRVLFPITHKYFLNVGGVAAARLCETALVVFYTTQIHKKNRGDCVLGGQSVTFCDTKSKRKAREDSKTKHILKAHKRLGSHTYEVEETLDVTLQR